MPVRCRRPAGFRRLWLLARTMRLSCPEGRALYACSRRQNGWPRICSQQHDWVQYSVPMSEVDVLTRTRQGTAKRWLEHWRSGGSIRTLGRSAEEQRAYRRRAAHYASRIKD